MQGRHGHGGRGERRQEREKIYIYGKHALKEALVHAPHAVKKAFLSGEAGADKTLRELLNTHHIPVTGLKGEIPREVSEESAHQGVIAIVDPSAILKDFNDFIGKIIPGPGVAFVLLDELTDPQNVGAIIRSAAAFGAAGVLIPPHNQAGITGAVVKASAGMVFSVPIVSIGNVNQVILRLKEDGFKIYALAMKGARDLNK